MNWASMLFTFLAEKQRWAASDKAHGALAFVVPMVEQELTHATITPGSNGGNVVTMHTSESAAQQFAGMFAAASTTKEADQ